MISNFRIFWNWKRISSTLCHLDVDDGYIKSDFVFSNLKPREFKMKLFWLFGHSVLADPGNADGNSPDLYPIADPISIVSLHRSVLFSLAHSRSRMKSGSWPEVLFRFFLNQRWDENNNYDFRASEISKEQKSPQKFQRNWIKYLKQTKDLMCFTQSRCWKNWQEKV